MSLKAFKEAVKEIGAYNKVDKKYPNYDGFKKVSNLDNLYECYLYIRWNTGGISGGSCWDDGTEDRHYHTTGEHEPNFDSLYQLLELVCPKITFIQYNILMSKVLEVDSYTDYEYYGNSTNYCIKTVNLGKMYDIMSEMRL